jgi:hypothetical protein
MESQNVTKVKRRAGVLQLMLAAIEQPSTKRVQTLMLSFPEK